MTLFVYVTSQCTQDARRHSVSADVDRVARAVEDTQSLSLFDPFPPPYLVKKKLHGRQHRLVAEVRKVGSHSVVLFLAVMIRGGNDYEQGFSQDPVAYGRQHFAGLVDDQTLEQLVQERTATNEVPGKAEPTPAEYGFLYSTSGHALGQSSAADTADTSLDRIVCESHRWVERSAQPRVQAQLNRLSGCCLQALSREPGLHHVPSSEKAGWGIWAYCSQGHVLLIDVTEDTNRDAAQAEAERLARLIEVGGTEALLQASRRAYPALVLADEQLWLELEREVLANMALSPEETEVLASARDSGRPYPLFINGRAGSGKSTILQYLFADLLFTYGSRFGYKPQGESPAGSAPGHPLYLTANGELLRVARQFVERLLRSEVRFSDLESGFDRTHQESLPGFLERTFREFRPFLLDLVGPGSRALFQAPKRVDYRRFRVLWDQRFGKDPKARREYGPDISWHVIRSYIKGMGSEDFLTPDDYTQLPENQLSVTADTFKGVYNQIWLGWYAQLQEEGYWDDQDLARHILEHDLAPRSYSAVFCDEAQDFTRLELEVLLRLNLYSNRALPSDAVSRVPFAFAGDEFQTLNPTGFRWDAVKASFVEKFIFELDPSRRGEKADLNYHELRYNYRSAEPIVRMGNLVQALRSASFGITELAPQRPWLRDGSGTPVLCFAAKDGSFWSAFREVASGVVIIVPCAEGEEAQYVASSDLLRPHIELTDEGLPRNVLSASRAKGCEYPAVMVFGFGEDLELDLMAGVGSPSAGMDASSRSLSLQYFINRLYVAVSRPKRKLIVVDTEAGRQKLWKAALDESARERLLGALKRGHEVWADHVGGMSPGRPADLSSDSVPDRLENARMFESDGVARRDAYLMNQASSMYREAGDTVQAKICKARALDFDEAPFEAGVAYAEAGLLEDARRCLWRAGRQGWLRLMELAREHPDQLGQIEVRWAKAILDKADAAAATDALSRLLARIEHDPQFAQWNCADPAWQQAIDALLGRLVQQDPTKGGLAQPVAAGLLETLDKLGGTGIRLPEALLPDLAFAAGQPGRAAEHWERVGDRRSPRYREAKAQSLPYPDNVEYLKLLERPADIVAAYDSHPGSGLTDAQATDVAHALMALKRLPDALLVAGAVASGPLTLEVAAKAFAEKNPELANSALRAALRHMISQAAWPEVAALVHQGELPDDAAGTRDRAFRSWVKERALSLRPEAVRQLARSDKLPQATAKQAQPISRFLGEFLRVRGGQWQRELDYMEAASALERAGKLTDALSFYESALQEPLGGDVVHEMHLRWLVVKYRLLEQERSHKPNSSEARRLESEIAARRQRWHITEADVAQLSRYPVLAGPRPEADKVGASPASAAPLAPSGAPSPWSTPALQPPAPPAAPPPTPPTPSLALAAVAQAVRSLSGTEPSEPAGAWTQPAPMPPAAGSDAPSQPPPAAASDPAAEAGRLPLDSLVVVGALRIETRRAKTVCLVTDTDTMESVRVDWTARKVSSELQVEQGADSWTVLPWALTIRLPVGGPHAVSLGFTLQGLSLQISR